MKYNLFILLLFLSTALTENVTAMSCANLIRSEASNLEFKENPIERTEQKKRKIKKSKSNKKFPLYGAISVSAAILTLLMLGLGIFLNYEIFMGIIAALLAISALVLAIIGLKKGESKMWNFIGLIVGAVAIVGVLFFAISISA
jgi:hypothetical protein